jgi:hypothetical protein
MTGGHLRFRLKPPIVPHIVVLPPGLTLAPHRRPILAAGLAALLVAGAILAVDLVSRSSLPAYYLRFYAGPDLWIRVAVMATKAVWEEALYRGVVMTGVAALAWWALGRPRALHWTIYVLGILIAQAANLLPNLPSPPDASSLIYDVLRYYLPGMVWGWLYWRHGWMTGALAHAGSHVILQPLLLVLLR